MTSSEREKEARERLIHGWELWGPGGVQQRRDARAMLDIWLTEHREDLRALADDNHALIHGTYGSLFARAESAEARAASLQTERDEAVALLREVVGPPPPPAVEVDVADPFKRARAFLSRTSTGSETP